MEVFSRFYIILASLYLRALFDTGILPYQVESKNASLSAGCYEIIASALSTVDETSRIVLSHLPLVARRFDQVQKTQAHLGRVFWSLSIGLCRTNSQSFGRLDR